MDVRRFEKPGITLVVLLFVALPTAIHGWPATVLGNVFTASLVMSGLVLMGWRTHSRLVVFLGDGLWLVAAFLGRDPNMWFPDTSLAILAALAAVAALAWAATCTSSGLSCRRPARWPS